MSHDHVSLRVGSLKIMLYHDQSQPNNFRRQQGRKEPRIEERMRCCRFDNASAAFLFESDFRSSIFNAKTRSRAAADRLIRRRGYGIWGRKSWY